MPTERSDTRRDYRHFPTEYADMLRAFARETRRVDYRQHPYRFGPLGKAEAASAKRDLYRYRLFLSAALDADPGDDYARDLFSIFNSVTLRSVEEHGSYWIVFDINPIVAAMRRANGGTNT